MEESKKSSCGNRTPRSAGCLLLAFWRSTLGLVRYSKMVGWMSSFDDIRVVSIKKGD